MYESITLLIVDDEPLTRRKIRCFQLAEHGYEIIGEAENGVQALELIDKFKPDIVVADIGMPVMDGLELLTQIQQRNGPPKVIMLTCYEDFTKAQTAIRLGACDYLTKLLLSEEDLLKGLNKAAYQLRKERSEMNRTIRFMLQELTLFSSEHALVQLRLIPFKPHQFALATIRSGSEADEWLALSHSTFETVNDQHRSIVIRMPERQWCVIFFSFEENHTCNFYNWCYQQCAYVSGKLNESLERREFVMSLIPIRHRLMELSAAYKEGIELLDSGFYAEKGGLLHDHNRRVFANDSADSIVMTIEGIRKSVNEWDFNEAASGIHGWLEIVGQLQPHPDCVRELGMEIVGIFASHVGVIGSNYQPSLLVLKHSLNEKLSSAMHLSDVSDVLELLTVSLINSLQDYPLTMRKEIKKAISYIHKHYRDVDLTSAADHVNLSPSWFKTLFFKETGRSFRDYLQHYQLKMAKQMLVTTDMKVYEVANEIGIPNTRYFSRLFTKLFSIPPLDYRKRTTLSSHVLVSESQEEQWTKVGFLETENRK